MIHRRRQTSPHQRRSHSRGPVRGQQPNRHHQQTQAPRTATPKPKPQNKGKRPARAKLDTGDTWFGWIGSPRKNTGTEAKVVIFNQMCKIFPSLFKSDMETLLVDDSDLNDMWWQLMHHVLVKLMKLSQVLRLKVLEQDARIKGLSKAQIAARQSVINEKLTDYLAQLKEAHAADKAQRDADKAEAEQAAPQAAAS